jgi:microcystin-dependent protein
MGNQVCIGQIVLFAGNFAPLGWLACNGSTLKIAANPALFSIIGDTYGGDGKTTFALPKLPNLQHAIYLIAVTGQFPVKP